MYFELFRAGIDPYQLTLDQLRLFSAASVRARARERLENLGDLMISQAKADARKRHAKELERLANGD